MKKPTVCFNKFCNEAEEEREKVNTLIDIWYETKMFDVFPAEDVEELKRAINKKKNIPS